MISVWSSALKDNEVNITDLPMPRILGEGEEEPVEVWHSNRGLRNLPRPKKMPKDLKFPLTGWLAYSSKDAGIKDGNDDAMLFPIPLDRLLRLAKDHDYDYVVKVDESYTVIDSWRVG